MLTASIMKITAAVSGRYTGEPISPSLIGKYALYDQVMINESQRSLVSIDLSMIYQGIFTNHREGNRFCSVGSHL